MVANQGVSLELTRQRVPDPAATDNLYVFYPPAHAVEAPEMTDWVNIIKKYYSDEKIETFTLFGLGGATAVVKALQGTRNLTRPGFIAELEKLRDFDTGVLSGKITFEAQKHAGVDQGLMITYRDGKPTLVSTWR